MSKHFCLAHIVDPVLSSLLRESDPKQTCDYCGRSPAVPLEVLVDALEAAISTEYQDPAHQVPYVSAEGGYQASLTSGMDLVLEMDDWTDSQPLLEDAAGELAATDWVQKDFFSLSPFARLSYGWEAFVEEILTKTRYLFFPPIAADPEDRGDSIHPSLMLSELGDLFSSSDLYADIPAGTPLHRARIVDIGKQNFDATTLGSPPKEKARANRMSPAGIPMFYCALDKRTAVEETLDRTRSAGKAVCVGTFVSSRTLKVLDLTSIPDPPSPFDFENSYRRPALQFLRLFADDLSKPVQRDGAEHIEYVPTQVVTEYARHRHKAGGVPLDGILYVSSRPNATKALVIFTGPDGCGDEATTTQALLMLRDVTLHKPEDFP